MNILYNILYSVIIMYITNTFHLSIVRYSVSKRKLNKVGTYLII